jgi:hypothetical protein
MVKFGFITFNLHSVFFSMYFKVLYIYKILLQLFLIKFYT